MYTNTRKSSLWTMQEWHTEFVVIWWRTLIVISLVTRGALRVSHMCPRWEDQRPPLFLLNSSLNPTPQPRSSQGWDRGHEAGQEDQDEDIPCGLVLPKIIKKHKPFGCVIKLAQPKPKIIIITITMVASKMWPWQLSVQTLVQNKIKMEFLV